MKRASTRTAVPTALIVCCLLAPGCGDPVPSGDVSATAGPVVPHPTVEYDLADIENAGTLRLITRYDSSSYFVHKGGPAGFDYELVERFARERGLTVDVVVPGPGEDPISLLNLGRGDLVCDGTVSDASLDRFVAQTRPTNFVRKVVVLPKESVRTADLEGLAGLTLTVPHGDPFRSELQELRETGRVGFLIGAGLPNADPDELIGMVADGKLEAAVVDDVLARAALTFQPAVRLGPLLGDRRPTVWLVRENSPQLKNALNAYLKKHIRVDQDGRTRRSQTYGIIYDRYYENPLTIREFRAPAHRPDKSGALSRYDDLIRRKSEAAGLDWRFVAALIYQESRFFAGARSRADARGLMQVLPRFAGPQADSLYVPDANLTAGLRLLRGTFDSYAYLDSLDRWRFTLAEYHAGHGHVTDARRMAMEMGRDPNRWRGSLALTLPRLMERKHFEKTRHGFYGGAITVRYVEEIMSRARMYSRLVPRTPPPPPPPDALDDLRRRLPGILDAAPDPE